jgi:dipeptidyl aminopeptidase/acylaminoacyl peptidase
MRAHFAAILLLLFGLCPGLAGGVPDADEAKKLFTIDDYFKVKSARLEDVSRDGRFIALSVSTPEDRLPQDHTRYGDPTYVGPSRVELVVVETATGKTVPVFAGKRHVNSATWSPDGKTLAYFERVGGRFELRIWSRESGRTEAVAWPKGKDIASGSPLIWSPDGDKLYVTTRTAGWEAESAEMFQAATRAPIIVMDSREPFLRWDAVRRRGNLAVPAVWDIDARKLTELLPETAIGSLRLTEDGSALVFERDVTEKTSYDVIFGTKNQLEVLPLPGGTPRVLMKPYDRRSFVWSKDRTTFAYADKGNVFVMSLDDKEPRQLTGEKEPAASKEHAEGSGKDEAPKKKQPTWTPVRFSPDGAFLLSTSARVVEDDKDADPPVRRPSPPRQYWLVGVRDGAARMIHELPEDEDSRPNLQVVDWSPDGAAIYFSTSAPDRWDRGLIRFDISEKRFVDLRRSQGLYRGWRMSEDGTTFVFTESDGDLPADFYAADREFRSVRRLTDHNPWLADRAVSHTELVSYRDADGKKLHGVLFYPANYEKGKAYPLVTEVYENYFDNGFNGAINVLASAGYAVLHPSVNLVTGYPGEAWAKGALAAINRVIEMGVADPDRLGIQGTSYGGYATVLLITQTDRFKAAVNNSGKVDMVSFYTQSPRLGVRNTHAPEKSQDRIGGTLWEYPERYLDHSAILRADRITTPLLCITGDLDPNVEALQSQEIYYALRRLGKTCVWLRYTAGPHGGPNTPEERADMYRRMIDWYDKYLMFEK